MADEQHSEAVQRWTAKRRAALKLSLLKGETTAAAGARRHGLKAAEIEEWRSGFYSPERTHCARTKEEDAVHEDEVSRLKAQSGRADHRPGFILHEAAKRPTTPGASDE
jgi:hypothetical protein